VTRKFSNYIENLTNADNWVDWQRWIDRYLPRNCEYKGKFSIWILNLKYICVWDNINTYVCTIRRCTWNNEHDDRNEQWTLRNEKQRTFGKHLSNDRSMIFWNSLQFKGHDPDRIKIGIIGVPPKSIVLEQKQSSIARHPDQSYLIVWLINDLWRFYKLRSNLICITQLKRKHDSM